MSLISKLSGSSGFVESGSSLTGDKCMLGLRFFGDRLTPPIILASTGRCAFLLSSWEAGDCVVSKAASRSKFNFPVLLLLGVSSVFVLGDGLAMSWVSSLLRPL